MDLQKVQSRIVRDLKQQIPELSAENIKITELPSKKNSVINVEFDKKPSKLPKEVVVKIFRTKNIVHEINILKSENSSLVMFRIGPDLRFATRGYPGIISNPLNRIS